ncbi:hypothetical protein CspeluHIS016_0703230 [Cutaneotrichosporon spelunceum]|uniref:Ubiquitinyl hydrolase 1 n=1 Tax=Cutaneotrichosporon spelunceum TaxID=1672016 RepID=A0AAD3TYL5_9TREE|nr:hypothetical protein CspeluHIS016_0703230 [Cutaneotrichosporon spelunceum]
MAAAPQPLCLPSVDGDTSICSHLRTLVQRGPEQLERRFVDVVRWGALDQGTKRRKTAAPACHTCAAPLSQPWACLTCDFVGCAPLHASTSRTARDCLPSHFANSTRCEFAVEPGTGSIFCSECDDCVYPDSFESLFRATRIQVEEAHDRSREGAIGGRGRSRGHWRAWDGKVPDKVARASCRGLRPLLNLSQTCFLSAILQALIHNPLLKAYFLSDKHNRHVCPNGGPRGLAVGKPAGMDGTPGEREKGCLCCEMDRAFEEFYADDSSPFGPITMLYSMWHASSELEGYGQQDAHSFFLAALDQIHAHAKGQLASCNCIAHMTFAGSLVSSVTCSGCGETNATVDPILDIQLDFPYIPQAEPLTLGALLRHYCAEEKIGDHGRGYACGRCGGGKGVTASKKLSIKKLPPVLSFQLKRFAHNATSSKVETPVRFPSHLDMRPYVETAAAPVSKAPSVVDGAAPAKEIDEDDLPSSLYSYDLFAVVTHEGKLDNGHYWADVRSGDEWWHCDDDKVTPTTLGAALRQNAYMLFYVRRSLAYGERMTSVLNNAQGAGKTVNGKANGVANGSASGTVGAA